MNAHIDKTHTKLATLAGLAQKTKDAEVEILKSALSQIKKVQSDIIDRQPSVLGGGDAVQNEYLALVKKRGELELVISKARTALGY